MMFSANLGFLWADLPLPEAIRTAKDAGFAAVECHWPYDVNPNETLHALRDTGLPMLGLNTVRGNVDAGENGLLALFGRQNEARASIDQALTYAAKIGASAIHLMAGKADGPQAHKQFISNLRYALDHVPDGMSLLIEPLNSFDAPGYFLGTTDQAADIIAHVDDPRLKLMFDCYHVARTEGDVHAKLHQHFDVIGHIQFAGVPTRGRPDEGTLDYSDIFKEIKSLGWVKPLGAEYKPGGNTDATLSWMASYLE